MLAVSSARADSDVPDAGVDAVAPPPPPADAQPAPQPTEIAPIETPPTDESTADDDSEQGDGHKKKRQKKKTPNDEGSLASSEQGDIIDDDSREQLVTYRFLFQTRYLATLTDPVDSTELDPRLSDGYAINRIFMRLTTKPRPWLNAKLLIDFAEITHRNPKKALKLAYAEIKLHKRVKATLGFFKRTYSLLELLPIADFELADVGPTDVLLKNAELAGRDPGAMIQVEPLHKKKWLTLSLAIFDGGLNGVDARALGLVTARAASQPVKHLRLGIDGAWRYHGQQAFPGFVPTTGPARAVSADVRYARKDFEVRAEWLWGDRADLLYRGDARTFMTAWAIAAVRIPVGDYMLMPAARLEWLDADREHPIGSRYVITGAINFMDVSDIVRILFDVSRSQIQAGTTPLSVAPVVLDKSSTALTFQVQVKI